MSRHTRDVKEKKIQKVRLPDVAVLLQEDHLHQKEVLLVVVALQEAPQVAEVLLQEAVLHPAEALLVVQPEVLQVVAVQDVLPVEVHLAEVVLQADNCLNNY